MKTTFIYTLCDPITEEPGYVGKSNDPQARYLKHCLARGYGKKALWIQSLKTKPLLFIIDEVPVSEWEFWENHYYYLYKSWGFTLHQQVYALGKGTAQNRFNSVKSWETRRKLGKTFNNPIKGWETRIKNGNIFNNGSGCTSEGAKRGYETKKKNSTNVGGFKKGCISPTKGKKMNKITRRYDEHK
jgi:hypothetical protein